MSAHVSIRGLTRRFGSFTALRDVSLDIPEGALVALLGPSGSGKTTLLRIIAGLDLPDVGQVLINGEDNIARHPRERGVGFVFQHYALFRHMTVGENIAFGLRVRPRGKRPSSQEITKRVAGLLDLVQLGWLVDRYPSELSGGQRQRVALARALAIEPRLLLLDEPFGALDTKVRKELGAWLRDLHHDQSITSLLVTHDQEEALELADHIVLMAQGRVAQIGTPADLYSRPATPFVLEFLGEANRLPCRIGEAGAALLEGTSVVISHSTETGHPLAWPGQALTLYVRPHDLLLEPDETGPAVITRVRMAGAFAKIEAQAQGAALTALMPFHRLAASGLGEGGRARLTVLHGLAFGPEEEGAVPLSLRFAARAVAVSA
ncbi:sulfate/molybdate ABC transporter ATP-binding protein [Acidisoma sp. 7E03]